MGRSIAVVIVSFNTRALLQACLESLHSAGSELTIFVVDNASHDGSADLVATKYPYVRLIRLPDNLGFGAANNLALEQIFAAELAPDSYVLLLNPDTVVHPGAVEQLAAFLDCHPRVALVGPRLLNPDSSLQRAAFRFPNLLTTALDLFPPGEVLPGRLYDSVWHGRYPEEHAADEPFPIDYPLGACMLARSTALARIGGFDRRFFIYSEEIDLCYRLRRAGWAIWQVPGARVTHVGGASTSQFRRASFVELHRSRATFVAIHGSPGDRVCHRALTRLGMLRLLFIAWHSFLCRQIDLAELRSRLWAYGEVARL